MGVCPTSRGKYLSTISRSEMLSKIMWCKGGAIAQGLWALAPLMGINYYTAMKCITLTSRGRIVHVNVVVFCRHWLFHEGFVKNDSIHFNMIVVFNQSVL